MRDQIIALLSQGLKQAEVSQIVGCDPSYISQLAKDKDFMADLVEARNKAVGTRVETRLANIEDSTAKVLESKMASLNADLVDLTELPILCKVLDSINNIRRSKVVAAMPGTNQNTMVRVAVSVNMIPSPNVIRNGQNEVVAIDGTELAAMPSHKVAQLFESMRSPIPVEEILNVSAQANA